MLNCVLYIGSAQRGVGSGAALGSLAVAGPSSRVFLFLSRDSLSLPLFFLWLHAATYAGGKEEEAATMALMQSGAVDAVAGALTASIMNERVVQHDLQAVVPFVTREADRAVTPRWV